MTTLPDLYISLCFVELHNICIPLPYKLILVPYTFSNIWTRKLLSKRTRILFIPWRLHCRKVEQLPCLIYVWDYQISPFSTCENENQTHSITMYEFKNWESSTEINKTAYSSRYILNKYFPIVRHFEFWIVMRINCCPCSLGCTMVHGNNDYPYCQALWHFMIILNESPRPSWSPLLQWNPANTLWGSCAYFQDEDA